MTHLMQELQALKPWDEVQTIKSAGIHYAGREATLDHTAVNGTYIIGTAGHGYLAVPKSHPLASCANKLCKYGFKGRTAYFLEEDCEMGLFLRQDAEAIKQYSSRT